MNIIEAQIQTELDQLCSQQQIDIIIAIESGSRAWGFPSSDSDYDVRIIYRHTPDWYLGVFDQKQTLNEPISGDLDIAGWDIRKALALLNNGNAVVHEWLQSPIVYRQQPTRLKTLQAFATAAFNPQAAFNHYFYMSRNKLASVESGNVTAKSFLYGLRTLLCACWIRDFASAPPMAFSILTQRYLADATLQWELSALLAAKKSGSERDVSPISAALISISQHYLETLEQERPALENKTLPPDHFNDIFRRLIQ